MGSVVPPSLESKVDGQSEASAGQPRVQVGEQSEAYVEQPRVRKAEEVEVDDQHPARSEVQNRSGHWVVPRAES